MDGLKEEEVENEAAANAAFWRHLLLMEAVLRLQIAEKSNKVSSMLLRVQFNFNACLMS